MTKNVKAKKSWWERLRLFLKRNTSLTVIIAAAILLELTTGLMYLSAQGIIQRTMERLVDREMNAIYLCIRNKLSKVEVTFDNFAWVVSDDLANPEWMFEKTRAIVKNNPAVLGSSISFIPDYYPSKGKWFEPYAVRRADGSIESMQLGSASHDYTNKEFFSATISEDHGHWCEPYYDKDGSGTMVTTYSVPVKDAEGRIVAVANGDISLGWLDEVMNESKMYKTTERFLVTGSFNQLAGADNGLYHIALDLVKASPKATDYVTAEDVDGRKVHVFFTPVGGNTNWVLINVLDDNEVFGKLRRMRAALLLPVMVGLFFAGLIIWRTQRTQERLRKVNAEKERIGGELRVASRIQQSMLPHRSLTLDDVDICGSLVPAKEVGGDLYDYFIRDEKLYFCIGDVSGKGAPSAMLMAVIHALFRAFSAHESNPARIMQAINEASCEGNDDNMFVTLFIGVLDLPTGTLRYCDAGHDAPFIITRGQRDTDAGDTAAATTLTLLDMLPHLPIGVFDDVKFTLQETKLAPESTVFLYTDGLTEAMNGSHQDMFGLKRTEDTLGRCAAQQLTPAQVISEVSQAVHRFVGDSEQSDDLTMLVMRYTPRQYESTLTETITIKNQVKEVARLSTFIKAASEKLAISTTLARQLRLAVEEAVVNVINYAYAPDTEGDVTVTLMSDGKTLRVQIIDAGVPFDPTMKEKADTSLSVEDRQIGGLGLLLVRELMDAINYERTESKNVLTLIKNLT